MELGRKWNNNHGSFSVGKGVLRNSAKFTSKHLSQSLFFDKVAGLRISNNTFFTEHVWATASSNYTAIRNNKFGQNLNLWCPLSFTEINHIYCSIRCRVASTYLCQHREFKIGKTILKNSLTELVFSSITHFSLVIFLNYSYGKAEYLQKMFVEKYVIFNHF